MTPEETFWSKALDRVFDDPTLLLQLLFAGFAVFVVGVLAAVLILREVRTLKIGWKTK